MYYGIYVFALFMLISSAVGIGGDVTNNDKKINADEMIISSLSSQMISYASYVDAYLSSHPTVTGTQTDSVLGIPGWFNKKDARISNYFSAGKAYVYCTSNCPASLETALSEATNKSINVGVASNGKLMRKGTVDQSYTLPAILKNGSVIYVLN